MVFREESQLNTTAGTAPPIRRAGSLVLVASRTRPDHGMPCRLMAEAEQHKANQTYCEKVDR